jgi:methylase of polypeptide subunit release factors
MALFGGRDGLKYYRQLARIEKGRIYIEIGRGQEKAVRKIFTDADWRFLSKHRDLSGRVRVLAFAKRV